MFNVDDLISFIKLTNARGYPLTGIIKGKNEDGEYSVLAFGLAGPGSETHIHGIPENEIELCTADVE